MPISIVEKGCRPVNGIWPSLETGRNKLAHGCEVAKLEALSRALALFTYIITPTFDLRI